MDGLGAKKLPAPEVFAIVVMTAFVCPIDMISAAEIKQSAVTTPVAGVPAASSLSSLSKIAPHGNIQVISVSRQRAPLFFGYVEFDFDPDAPGGVPGFGPLRPEE